MNLKIYCTCVKIYNTINGIITTIKIGVDTEITTKVLVTKDNIIRKKLNVLGSISSMILISLENRLTIRPSGVVSKKDIGAWRTRSSIRRCSNREPFSTASAPITLVSSDVTALDAPKAPYTPRYKSLTSGVEFVTSLHLANQKLEPTLKPSEPK